jgi:hypothetical protein
VLCVLPDNVSDWIGIDCFPEFVQPRLKSKRMGWSAEEAVLGVEPEGNRSSVQSASSLHDGSRSLSKILGSGQCGHAQFPVRKFDSYVSRSF